MPTATLTRRRLQLALVAVTVLSIAVHAWDLTVPGLLDRTGRLKAPDFLQFYTYGWLARAHQWHRLYDPEAHAAVAREHVDPNLAFTGFLPNYSPVVALIMAPFTNVSFLPAWGLWSAISLVLYVAAIAFVSGMTVRVRADRPSLTLVAVAFPALFVVIRYGQISALSLVLVAAAGWLYSRRLRFAAGFVLGALAYKPTLLLIPLLALASVREWRVLLGLVIAACLETAASLALVGPTGFTRYVGILATLAMNPDLVQAIPTESHSLRGFVRLLLPSRPLLAVISFVAIAVATWSTHRVWRTFSDSRPRWAALTVAALVASPHLLTYDLLLLIVPLLLILDWVQSTGTSLTGVWWTVVVLLYGAAWPGTFLARLYGIQPSTIGMALALWLLVVHAPRFASLDRP